MATILDRKDENTEFDETNHIPDHPKTDIGNVLARNFEVPTPVATRDKRTSTTSNPNRPKKVESSHVLADIEEEDRFAAFLEGVQDIVDDPELLEQTINECNDWLTAATECNLQNDTRDYNMADAHLDFIYKQYHDTVPYKDGMLDPSAALAWAQRTFAPNATTETSPAIIESRFSDYVKHMRDSKTGVVDHTINAYRWRNVIEEGAVRPMRQELERLKGIEEDSE